MAGRRSEAATARDMGLEGHTPLPGRAVRKRKANTAGQNAEAALNTLIGRARWNLERVLRAGEDGGVTLGELEEHEKGWSLRCRVSMDVLKLAKGTRVGARKATADDAETEPEDDEGVQQLCERLGGGR